jgi:hypothetical protein
VPSNNALKLTAPAQTGAPQLSAVLGRPKSTERVAIFVVLALTLGACDTMIADRMIIRTTAQGSGAAPSTSELLATSRDAFTECRLPEGEVTSYRDTLHWRNPNHPPGLHVMIHPAGGDLRVTLAQDLYGPIGATDAYRCVRKTLRRRLEERFGKDRVRLDT